MTIPLTQSIKSHFGVPEVRRLARTLMACALSYGAARLATLPEGYWALITTLVVVTQPSLTQTLGTARDQIIGACLGAAVGVLGIVAIVQGATPIIVFFVALLPLAVLAALDPGLRLACVTLVIVVLIPGDGGSPFERPIHRVLEIIIGASAAFIVAVIWPNRAIRTAHRSVADSLRSLAQLIGLHLSGRPDATRASQLENRSEAALRALDEALKEAGREHVFVPIRNERSDAIDKVAPFLGRLHRDAQFLGKAVMRDAVRPDGASAGRVDPVDPVDPVLPKILTTLADALDAVPIDDRKTASARTMLQEWERGRTAHAGDTREDSIVGFVIGLIANDIEGLLQVLSPASDGGTR
ncbi:membrane protein-like protein [Caballeronia choica]|uniref:Membrane protein-like protein n=1 Tax=Caballeronia choica TaxID=326476 RepID=A0A158KPF8_9BURK|nr:FUSC family protein [Caballeronia choica]SAL82311.1 membrane protein-like protein [Caballeronia choica]